MSLATMELDPVFVRALRLLHSRSKDSKAQLKTMLDEAIRHRRGLGPGPSGAVSPRDQQRFQQQQQHQQRSRELSDSKQRSLDKLKHDLSELVPSKRPRLDSPRSGSAGGFSSKSHTPSPTPPGSSRGGNANGGGVESNSSTEDPLMGELDMLDYTCCVCRSITQANGNKLMECHTCQDMYHQECHQPAVTNEEANDPRLVWNCSRCSIKVPTLKPNKPVTSNSSPTSSRGSPSLMAMKSSTIRSSPSKVSGGKPAGMAVLAASYKPSSSSSSSKSSSSSTSSSRSSRTGSSSCSSSSTLGSTSNNGSKSSSLISAAEKRMQMMKKKAAARKVK